MSENVFTLSKREQRAIIAIVLALLIGTLVLHFRGLRTEAARPEQQSSPSAAPAEEEQDATR